MSLTCVRLRQFLDSSGLTKSSAILIQLCKFLTYIYIEMYLDDKYID